MWKIINTISLLFLMGCSSMASRPAYAPKIIALDDSSVTIESLWFSDLTIQQGLAQKIADKHCAKQSKEAVYVNTNVDKDIFGVPSDWDVQYLFSCE